jgi:hypothetical protein
MPPQLGISLLEPKAEPILSIYRFRVYTRETFALLQPHERKRNLNFQIYGDSDCEKIVFRMYMDENKCVYKSRYYYREGMDKETAEYLVMELLECLKKKYKFRDDHECKEIKWL